MGEIKSQQKRRYPQRKRRGADDLPEGLRNEIGMVRKLMRQAMTWVDDCKTMDELLRLLDMVSKAATRLGNLLNAERQLDNGGDSAGSASQKLNDALAEVIEDLGYGKKQGGLSWRQPTLPDRDPAPDPTPCPSPFLGSKMERGEP